MYLRNLPLVLTCLALASRVDETPVPAYADLGSLSEKYESDVRGPLAISPKKRLSDGKEDEGDVSYGSFQMASKRGLNGSTVWEFAKSAFPGQFDGLDPGTPDFTQKWIELAKRDLAAR
jgi:hypothetical protein